MTTEKSVMTIMKKLDDELNKAYKKGFQDGLRAAGMKHNRSSSPSSPRRSSRDYVVLDNGYDSHGEEEDASLGGQKFHRKDVERWAKDKDRTYVLYHWTPCGPCRNLRTKIGVEGNQKLLRHLEDGHCPELLMIEQANIGDDVGIEGFPTIEVYEGGKRNKKKEDSKYFNENVSALTRIVNAFKNNFNL